MTEHRSPIPARVYNAAVGGHVCGPDDIDFGQKVVHLIKYDRTGNEVSFESQVTQANKIYVIPFLLSETFLIVLFSVEYIISDLLKILYFTSYLISFNVPKS